VQGNLGPGAGRVSIRSRRSTREKPPWKSEPPLTGMVERQFVRPLLVGDSVLPYAVQ
jgi:hypothetical protein